MTCRFLRVRIAFEILVGRATRPHAMFGTKRPHGPLADRNALRAVQIGGEFGRSPVGAVQATAGGAVLLGIVLAIVGFVWYPIKRWRRSKSNKAAEDRQRGR